MNKKVGLVLEGGAMRGMFTAGVLDLLMEENILVDGIIGVSAGALFGANYFSNQPGRVIRYSKRFCKDKRYISKLSLFLTGNIVNKNFAYYKVTNKLDPFDNKTFRESEKDYYVVVTNLETGEAEYKKIKDIIKDMEYLRASSAMPFASKIIKINNKKYLDGAIGDSIPFEKCLELGYKKVIVILTRPLNYRKNNLSNKNINLVKNKFKKYPKFVNSVISRPTNYNHKLEKIIDYENKKLIFVIMPSKDININVIERNPDKLQEVYDLGYSDANNIVEDLKKYISE